jgi:hypothetical protein
MALAMLMLALPVVARCEYKTAYFLNGGAYLNNGGAFIGVEYGDDAPPVGSVVRFTETPPGVNDNRNYYVITKSGDSPYAQFFRISKTPGGAPVKWWIKRPMTTQYCIKR